ncbi:hypothetical protein [Ponticaulis sp.]|uniref:hypothetical protein n=1 Tax=Ponticaulis sp. TaxID=2020902 RepID=UPI000C3D0E45|nr:hypothetical protein [Ponticaulis sp.]MAF57605.1 hypothetical protein [Ponticaulis sp.]MBN03628.1 hypothetical protein [Ponticaulis sp.]
MPTFDTPPERGKPSRILTKDDAIQVWFMKWDGWLQSRIAAHFDTNQGRISEVINLKRHPSAYEAALYRRGRAA